MTTFTFSVERLVHFQCSACHKWWSIGDAPEREFWFCPWCGAKLLAHNSSAASSNKPVNSNDPPPQSPDL